MKLRQLTYAGTKKLQKDVNSFKNQINPQININQYDSEIIPDINLEVTPYRLFKNKYEIGKYLNEVFAGSGLILSNEIWNWLSLAYYRQLLNSQGRIGEVERLFIFPNRARKDAYPFVHTLKGPYDVYRYYYDKGELRRIKFLLNHPVNIHNGLYLEIVKRPKIMKNINFISVVRHLFSENDEIKRNYTYKSLKRLIQLYQQYDRSFDMYHLRPKQFLAKLSNKHKEFHPFLSEKSKNILNRSSFL